MFCQYVCVKSFCKKKNEEFKTVLMTLFLLLLTLHKNVGHLKVIQGKKRSTNPGSLLDGAKTRKFVDKKYNFLLIKETKSI